MVEGQNVYRRKRGQTEATEEEFQGRGAERSRESLDRARRHDERAG
jgi:hypothetical protein